MHKRIAAMVLSDEGVLLPETCRGNIEQCEEDAPNVLLGWEAMKKLGAKVVQVEITVVSKT